MGHTHDAGGERIGLIGAGAIGTALLRINAASDAPLSFVGVLTRSERPNAHAVPVVTDVQQLLALRPAVVAEAAGHDALRAHGATILRSGSDLLIVAIGALADPATERELRDAAEEGNSRLQIVSGALGALDALAAASVDGLRRVVHTTRKPPASLLPADEAAALVEPRVLYHGSAREAAALFPESINVAAAVSMAGIGFDATEVQVIADPAVTRNQHTVEAEGAFGNLTFRIENIPSAENPRTGTLTAMSLLHALRRRSARVLIG